MNAHLLGLLMSQLIDLDLIRIHIGIVFVVVMTSCLCLLRSTHKPEKRTMK